MLHSINNVVVLALTSLTLVACGGGGSFSPGEGILNFNGTWVSECDPVDNVYLKQSITITGNNMTVDINEYGSSDCTGITSYTEQVRAGLLYGADKPSASSVCTNVKKVDITFSSATVNGIPLTQSEILTFLELPSTTFYDLICSKGNQLFSGKITATLDGTTADKRPEFIDHTFAFTK